MARKTFPTSIRAAIWQAHERRCIYCTELVTFADLDIDHIVPSHLKDRPEELAKLLHEYGLNNRFDVDSLFNLVPSHRHCNLQKKGQVLTKSRAIHFLTIAEGRYKKACTNELELKKQAKKDKFTILIHVALDEGLISHEDLNSLVADYAGSQNSFEVLTALPFVDSELKGFLSSTDVDSLYDRPILPRLHGLDTLKMARVTLSNEEQIEVCTCREWVEAIRDSYRARSTYDIKEETFFKNIYSLVVALAQAKAPKKSFISDVNASIANFNLLPVTLLPVLSGDSVRELQHFKSEGIGISDLIAKGRIKIISSSPLALTLHYDYMGLSLYEILRADLNDDGIEDLLIGTYEWALEGTYGVGSTIALTRLGIDQPFTIADNIELDVYRLDNHRIQADAAEPRR